MGQHIWDVKFPMPGTVGEAVDCYRYARSKGADWRLAAAFAGYVIEQVRQQGGPSPYYRKVSIWDGGIKTKHRWSTGKHRDNYFKAGAMLLRWWVYNTYTEIRPGTDAQRLYTAFYDHPDEITWFALFDALEEEGLEPEREDWGL